MVLCVILIASKVVPVIKHYIRQVEAMEIQLFKPQCNVYCSIVMIIVGEAQ